MKRIFAVILAILLIFSLTGCGAKKPDPTPEPDPVVEDKIKVGLICLHDENSTYDLNFISAFNAACKDMGVEGIIMTNIPETEECYNAAVDLADKGCVAVFADSFGHEDYMIEAAKEFPDVQFCHATGTKAHTEGLENFHNAFAAIYEGRFLDGVAAGMKLNEMIAEDPNIVPKVGYVGAYTYAEVISGYTSFFLGVKSECPTATMEVTFTGSWYDETAEKEAANKLIGDGCVFISGHADSMGAPTVCENLGVPFVFYNGSVKDACPNSFIVSTKIDWAPYFKYAINCVQSKMPIDTDWTGTIATGSVVMTDVNEAVAAAGTADRLAEITAKFKSGELSVFDTATFSVGGEMLTSYLADVDTDPAYEGDTEAIVAGVFQESVYRSAPYFDLRIDGIVLADEAY
jgi:basic membrane protein A